MTKSEQIGTRGVEIQAVVQFKRLLPLFFQVIRYLPSICRDLSGISRYFVGEGVYQALAYPTTSHHLFHLHSPLSSSYHLLISIIISQPSSLISILYSIHHLKG